MKKLFIALLLPLLVSAPIVGFANGATGKSCYTPAELHAEEFLRLHSFLMVVTVTCRTGSQGENLVPEYTGFTNNHIAEIKTSEGEMKQYYHAHGGGSGMEKLDQLRTRLGNEYGQQIATMSAPAFCGAYRDKVDAFYGLPQQDLEKEVSRMMVSEKSYQPQCASGAPLASPGK